MRVCHFTDMVTDQQGLHKTWKPMVLFCLTLFNNKWYKLFSFTPCLIHNKTNFFRLSFRTICYSCTLNGVYTCIRYPFSNIGILEWLYIEKPCSTFRTSMFGQILSSIYTFMTWYQLALHMHIAVTSSNVCSMCMAFSFRWYNLPESTNRTIQRQTENSSIHLIESINWLL